MVPGSDPRLHEAMALGRINIGNLVGVPERMST